MAPMAAEDFISNGATAGEEPGGADEAAPPGEPPAVQGEPATETDALALEMAKLMQERDEAIRRAEDCWDRYLRAEAEIENTRKRALRQREEALAAQRRELLSRVLAVADNLERALAHAGEDSTPLRSGIETTYRELTRMLAAEGVERIEALNAPFDPMLHEATAVVPRPDLDAERVIAVDLPGYLLDGVLLRPAKVVVGKPTGEGPSENG